MNPKYNLIIPRNQKPLECILLQIAKAISTRQDSLAYLVGAEIQKIKYASCNDATPAELVDVSRGVIKAVKSAANMICAMGGQLRMITGCCKQESIECGQFANAVQSEVTEIVSGIAGIENELQDLVAASSCVMQNELSKDDYLNTIAGICNSVTDIVLTAKSIEISLAGEICCASKFLTNCLASCGCFGVISAEPDICK
jgi:hypothetical protein